MEGIDVLSLKALVAKIEKLDEDKDDLRETVKELWQEVKAVGFNVMVLKKVLALRKLKKGELSHYDETLKLYRDTLDV